MASERVICEAGGVVEQEQGQLRLPVFSGAPVLPEA